VFPEACGVYLMCLPLGGTTETVESPGASCNLQGTYFLCTFRIKISLSFNLREMYLIRSPTMMPRMLAVRVTLRFQEDKPSTHQNVCGGEFMNGCQMEKAQYKNVLMHKLYKKFIGE
jgi:hypothetical protein